MNRIRPCVLRNESLRGFRCCTVPIKENKDPETDGQHVETKTREPIDHLPREKTPSQGRPYSGAILVVFVERAERETRRHQPGPKGILRVNSQRSAYAYSFSGRSRSNILG